jgi:ariadne-1
MDLDAFNVSSKGKQKCYEVDYTTLSQQDVEALMREHIEHISGIFGVEASLLCIQPLLIY